MMDWKKETTVSRMLYVVIFMVSSLPLACGYIMQGGEIALWIARIEEVKEHLQAGRILWFPSAQLTVTYRGQFSAFYSNVWLLFPAFLRVLGVSVIVVYQIYLLLLNGMALVTAKKMFEEILAEESDI